MERVSFYTILTSMLAISFIIAVVSSDTCEECFSPWALALKAVLIGFIFILGTFHWSRIWLKVDSLIFKIERQPLSFISKATEGTCLAIQGKIACNLPVYSPYTNSECVFFHSITEKFQSSDSGGKWILVENKHGFTDFFVEDKSGRILIDALATIGGVFSSVKLNVFKGKQIESYSEIDCVKALYQKEYFKEKQGFMGLKSKQKLRKSEYVLPNNANVFAFGFVKRDNKGQLMLAEEENFPLIISRKSKDEYVEDFAKGDNFFYWSNLFIVIGITFAFFGVNYFIPLPFFLLVVFLCLILFRLLYGVFNRFVVLSGRAKNSLSQIDIELHRRFALLPRLVNLVSDYAKHEKEILKLIAEERASLVLIPEDLTAKSDLINKNILAARNLLAVVENYPALKASENFKALQTELSETENRIASAREFFNKSVLKYNILADTFPFMLVALLFRFRKKNYFEQ